MFPGAARSNAEHCSYPHKKLLVRSFLELQELLKMVLKTLSVSVFAENVYVTVVDRFKYRSVCGIDLIRRNDDVPAGG